MTRSEAWDIFNAFHHKSDVTEEDEFLYTEAIHFLMEDDDPQSGVGAFNLAVTYYKHGEYELAWKYFNRVADEGDPHAEFYVGMMAYYGLAGEPDYERAYNCFTRLGKYKSRSRVMLAVMYRDGNYVDEDYEMYRSMIEGMYDERGGQTVALPYVSYHMAEIYMHDCSFLLACFAYGRAQAELDAIIYDDPGVSEMELMQELVEKRYSLEEIDLSNLEFFDLYQVLRKPCRVQFEFEMETHYIQSHLQNGDIEIEFEGKWYRDISSFLSRFQIGKKRMIGHRREITGLRVSTEGIRYETGSCVNDEKDQSNSRAPVAEYEKELIADKTIMRMLKKAHRGEATQEDVRDFSVLTGTIASRCILLKFENEYPNGRVSEYDVRRIISPVLREQHKVITEMVAIHFNAQYKKEGIGLSAVKAKYDIEREDELVRDISKRSFSEDW